MVLQPGVKIVWLLFPPQMTRLGIQIVEVLVVFLRFLFASCTRPRSVKGKQTTHPSPNKLGNSVSDIKHMQIQICTVYRLQSTNMTRWLSVHATPYDADYCVGTSLPQPCWVAQESNAMADSYLQRGESRYIAAQKRYCKGCCYEI